MLRQNSERWQSVCKIYFFGAEISLKVISLPEFGGRYFGPKINFLKLKYQLIHFLYLISF